MGQLRGCEKKHGVLKIPLKSKCDFNALYVNIGCEYTNSDGMDLHVTMLRQKIRMYLYIASAIDIPYWVFNIPVNCDM